ncbi:photosystem I reaction center subunit PsaK [Synechocystis sp. PCC 7509]|uniref:photosystem I reaction center subunit PsaK n=1 Tax=Synechocystis sp. PCC 7509 TaxID=927677 RepID=UPI0002EE4FE9|nr:photosystem I reaction center subunit PsaK [Synechocystis sp. PCC 7509]
MLNLMLLAAVQPTVPDTVRWSWTGTAIIVGISLVILFIAGRTIRYPQAGPKMPLPFPALFNNPSVGTFLASMSFGHIIGIATVLGLTNIGALK